MIKISNLTFDYPGHRALNNVSLSVAAGSVTALVGPNGAGKTTLLRCIAGLETPLSGTIHVADMDVVEKPREVHRMMGYLSDFFGLYQDLTVAQCLEYAAAAQGLPALHMEAAIRQTAQQLSLSDRLQQTSGSLSRGLRQRVAIGQSIIHKPKVLLLDEPASGLDPEARSELATLFRLLQSEGMTLIVSSHILAELDEYSTHLLSLRDGRVLENRVLAAAHHVSAERHIRITLAQPDARMESWLQLHTAVTLLAIKDNVIEIALLGDLSDQAYLLQQMVSAGFTVASFAEHKENLQQSYLRAVAEHLENKQ